MSESPTITRITHIEDPALIAFAARVAHSLLAAGHIAAAHLGRSDLFGTSAGDALQRSWSSYLKGCSRPARSALTGQSVRLVTTGQVPGFKGVESRVLHSAINCAKGHDLLSLSARRPDERFTVKPVTSVEHRVHRPSHEQWILGAITRSAAFTCEYPDPLDLVGVTVDPRGIAARMTRVRLDFQHPRRLRLAHVVPYACKVALIDGTAGALIDRLLDEACRQVTAGMHAAGDSAAELVAAVLDRTLENMFAALVTWWNLDVVGLLTHFLDPRSTQRPYTHIYDANSHDGRFDLRFEAHQVSRSAVTTSYRPVARSARMDGDCRISALRSPVTAGG